MNAYLIIYKISAEVDESSIINQVKSNHNWAKVSDNCWMVVADKSSANVRDELKSAINGKGSILVINITNQGWGTFAMPKGLTDWMKENLKQ